MDLAMQAMDARPQDGANHRKIREKRAYVARVNHGGNFCGHQPDSPRLDLVSPTTDKQRPGILIELQARIKRYFDNPDVIPSLRNANGSKQGRQMRSERREACLVLLAVIVEYMDLVSLRVGIPTSKGFVSLTLDKLVQFTGLHPRRAERALADLKKANLLTVSQPRQLKEDGTWRGLAAVKAVNKLLFTVFGLHERLKHEIERAAERLASKVKKVGGSLTSWSRNALLIGKNDPDKSRAIHRHFQPSSAGSVEVERVRQPLLAQLRTEHPTWSREDVYAEAERIMAEKIPGVG